MLLFVVFGFFLTQYIFLENSRQTLRHSEWVVIFSLLMILASFVIGAKINALKCASIIENSTFPPHPECMVTIKGLVMHEGSCQYPVGTQLKKIIRKAKPSLFADLSCLDLEKRLGEPLVLEIKEFKEIEVRLIVEDEEIQIFVPCRTRVCDLKKISELSQWSAHPALRGRRVLKPKEVIDLRAPKSQEKST